jgi:hypothetical protein
MYATLSYDVNAGPESVETVRRAILDAFADRNTCDLLSDTFICEIEKTSDYLAVVRKLRKIGSDFPGQFLYVFTLHNTGAPLRSNAVFSKSAVNEIIDPGDDE